MDRDPRFRGSAFDAISSARSNACRPAAGRCSEPDSLTHDRRGGVRRGHEHLVAGPDERVRERHEGAEVAGVATRGDETAHLRQTTRYRWGLIR
jgi:hypothetical protein